MTPDEIRALWRRIGIPAAIELAFDLVMFAALAAVTVEAPNGIRKLFAIAAIVLIIIAWTLRARRRISRWKWKPD